MSEETKGKISYYNSNLKTYSDETRKKISDSKIGIKRDSSTWNKKYNVEPYKKVNSKKIEQYTKEGIFIREWDSLNDAKDYFNLKSSSISNALTGRSSTANGFIWKYKL